jgi:hypothetical protein
MIFIVLGFGQVTLNWSAEAFTTTPLEFQLFSVGFTKWYYQPVMLQLSMPLGAIAFWVRRSRVAPTGAGANRCVFRDSADRR